MFMWMESKETVMASWRNMSDQIQTYGGQAVIEGVMMRGSHSVAVAMRAPDKNIVLLTEKLGSIYKSGLTKIPFLRGLVLLWDALGLGMKALTLSANLQTGEDENLEGFSLFLTIVVSLLIGIGLFFLAPAAIGQWLQNSFGSNAWWSNIGEGIVRLLFLIGYIWSIGFLPDIQRVFAYHGAEHKTINAYEAGAELTPENVKKYSLEHPRCGTSFLLSLVLISILIFSLLGPMSLALRLITRILFIPLLAGIAYEYIRWTANHSDVVWVRALIRPNMVLQRLTTREPSQEIIEVGIAAFNAMKDAENELLV
jgi:uncharacterized protein YqhQ